MAESTVVRSHFLVIAATTIVVSSVAIAVFVKLSLWAQCLNALVGLISLISAREILHCSLTVNNMLCDRFGDKHSSPEANDRFDSEMQSRRTILGYIIPLLRKSSYRKAFGLA